MAAVMEAEEAAADSSVEEEVPEEEENSADAMAVQLKPIRSLVK